MSAGREGLSGRTGSLAMSPLGRSRVRRCADVPAGRTLGADPSDAAAGMHRMGSPARTALSSRGLPARASTLVGLALAAWLIAASPLAAQDTSELEGVWGADRYLLATGEDHEVQGRIFFVDGDWQVLFFVMGGNGEAMRGSGEGGSYMLDGEDLVLTHLFNLSAGQDMPGLPAQELGMVSRPSEGAPTEPTRIDVEGDRLTLFFPSGNRMTFRRR